jgi:hypothetical protein
VPIHGNIEEAGLPDVLQLLALGRKSGCLSVVDGDQHGEIFLDIGRVTYAAVANRDRLGELLLRNGRITKEQLEVAAAEQSRGNERQIGRILLASGNVERADVERYVRMQVEEAIYTLFTWKQGSFTFTSDRRSSRGTLLVSIDAESLLLEGARRVDEWSQFEKKIPSFDLVFQRTRSRATVSGSQDLTEDQKTILPLLDGTRDVTGLVEASGLGEFDVAKALYGLIVAGFARLLERREQIRHLDYRELLAYVVREAELADPKRRKQAARHIVDCPECSERLRTIHVRRTEGGLSVPPEALEDTQPSGTGTREVVAAPLNGAAAKQVRTARAAEPPAEVATLPAVSMPEIRLDEMPELRAHLVPDAPPTADEQSVTQPVPTVQAPAPAQPFNAVEPLAVTQPIPAREERRRTDRRAGRDRRHMERRAGLDRRQGANPAWAQLNVERRRGQRRADDFERAALPARDRRGSGRRAQPPQGQREDAAAAYDARPGARATEARRITTVPQLPEAAGAAAPAPPPAAAAPVPPGAGAQPPLERRPDGSAAELVWLMSPDESLELVRASRQSRRATDPPRASPPPATSPEGHFVERRRSPPHGHTPRPQYTPQPAPAPQQSLQPARVTPAPGPRGITIQFRHLAIAAGIGAVALVGYAAGQLGARGAGAPALEATSLAQSSGQSGTAEASPPPAAQPAPVAERRPPASEPAPLQQRQEPRPEPREPAQTRVGAQTAPAPQPRATEPAAPPVQTREPLQTAPQQVAAPQPVAEAPAPQPAPAAPVTTVPVTSAPAAEADRELSAGGWAVIQRGEAIEALGGGFGVIQGLGVESIARSTTGRTRIRVSQVAPTGERILLTQSRSGGARGAGPAAVTAIRVMPPSEAYPYSSGTVTLGTLMITARSTLPPDALRSLLERLAESQ